MRRHKSLNKTSPYSPLQVKGLEKIAADSIVPLGLRFPKAINSDFFGKTSQVVATAANHGSGCHELKSFFEVLPFPYKADKNEHLSLV